jgi:dihydroorotase
MKTGDQTDNPETILLKNGRIIDPANNIDTTGDLLINNGLIADLGNTIDSQHKDCKTFELDGKLVVPGLIDMHVHLREPGEEYKETILSGTRAAIAGGFTAIACMPNTNPVNDNQAVTALILERARESGIRVLPIGCISQGGKGEKLAEFGDLKAAGAVAMSDDGRPVSNSQLMRRALEYSTNYDLPIISHSEELSLSHNGSMNEGALSSRLGIPAIPSVAEEIMVYRDISLAAYTKRPIHLAHISTGESVDLIRRAKAKGIKVTAEAAPHHFSLTESAVGKYNANAKMNPPLRTEEDQEAIKRGLADGTIDAIATDHAPHSELEKNIEFDLAANGIIGLETAIPLTLALVREGVFDYSTMVRLLSMNPANILKVEGGNLSRGSKADITIIDPELNFTFSKESIISKSKNSPFIDWKLKGKAVMTISKGRLLFRS